MSRRIVGWVMALTGLALWLPARFLGRGPLVGMDGTLTVVLVAVLCWGGLLLLGGGGKDETAEESQAHVADD